MHLKLSSAKWRPFSLRDKSFYVSGCLINTQRGVIQDVAVPARVVLGQLYAKIKCMLHITYKNGPQPQCQLQYLYSVMLITSTIKIIPHIQHIRVTLLSKMIRITKRREYVYGECHYKVLSIKIYLRVNEFGRKMISKTWVMYKTLIKAWDQKKNPSPPYRTSIPTDY